MKNKIETFKFLRTCTISAVQASYKGEFMLRSLQSFIQPAMLDLEMESEGEGGRER